MSTTKKVPMAERLYADLEELYGEKGPLETLVHIVSHGGMTVPEAAKILDSWNTKRWEDIDLGLIPEMAPDVTEDQWDNIRRQILGETHLGKRLGVSNGTEGDFYTPDKEYIQQLQSLKEALSGLSDAEARQLLSKTDRLLGLMEKRGVTPTMKKTEPANNGATSDPGLKYESTVRFAPMMGASSIPLKVMVTSSGTTAGIPGTTARTSHTLGDEVKKEVEKAVVEEPHKRFPNLTTEATKEEKVKAQAKWLDDLRELIKDGIAFDLGTDAVKYTKSDIERMLVQIPGLSPGRTLQFEEFRRFFRWAVSTSIHPQVVANFVEALHANSVLETSTIHEVGKVADIKDTPEGKWLRGFGDPSATLKNITENPQDLAAKAGVKLDIVRVAEPRDLANQFRDLSKDKFTDLLADLVTNKVISKDYAAEALGIQTSLKETLDKTKQEISKRAGSLKIPTKAMGSVPATDEEQELLNLFVSHLATQVSDIRFKSNFGMDKEKSKAENDKEEALTVESAGELFNLVLQGRMPLKEQPNLGPLNITESDFANMYTKVLQNSSLASGKLFANGVDVFRHLLVKENNALSSIFGDSDLMVPAPKTKWETSGKPARNLIGFDENEEESEEVLSEKDLNINTLSLASQVVNGFVCSVELAKSSLTVLKHGGTVNRLAGEKSQTGNYYGAMLVAEEFKEEFFEVYKQLTDGDLSAFRPSEAWNALPGLVKMNPAPTGESQRLVESAINDFEVDDKEYWKYLVRQVASGEMYPAYAARLNALRETVQVRMDQAEKKIRSQSMSQVFQANYGGNKPQKESQKMSKAEIAKNTIKSDLKEIALRTGVRRTRKLLADKVAEFWAKRSTTRQAGETDAEFFARAERNREGVAAFLLSDAGQGALAYMVGFAFPMLEDQIPEEVREYGGMVAKEIRIQGGTDILDGFIEEVVMPLGAVLKDEAMKFTSGGASTTTQLVQTRIDTAHVEAEATKPSEKDKDAEILALKAQLASLQTVEKAVSPFAGVATK